MRVKCEGRMRGHTETSVVDQQGHRLTIDTCIESEPNLHPRSRPGSGICCHHVTTKMERESWMGECGEQSHRYASACADKGVERCMDCERLRPAAHESESIPQENRPEIVVVWAPGTICTCNQWSSCARKMAM